MRKVSGKQYQGRYLDAREDSDNGAMCDHIALYYWILYCQ